MSEIKVDIISNADGTERLDLCKAWVTFEAVGTVSILDSFNISSVSDISTGDFNVIFDTDFIDTNYTVIGMSMKSANNQITTAGHFATTKTVGNHGIATRTSSSGAAADPDFIYVGAWGRQS